MEDFMAASHAHLGNDKIVTTYLTDRLMRLLVTPLRSNLIVSIVAKKRMAAGIPLDHSALKSEIAQHDYVVSDNLYKQIKTSALTLLGMSHPLQLRTIYETSIINPADITPMIKLLVGDILQKNLLQNELLKIYQFAKAETPDLIELDLLTMSIPMVVKQFEQRLTPSEDKPTVNSVFSNSLFNDTHTKALVQFVKGCLLPPMVDIIKLGIVISKNHPEGYSAEDGILKGQATLKDAEEALTMKFKVDTRFHALSNETFRAILATLDPKLRIKFVRMVLHGEAFEGLSLVTILAYVASQKTELTELYKKMFALVTEIYDLKPAAVQDFFEASVTNLLVTNMAVVEVLQETHTQHVNRPK
jgi:hypothetical protein